MPDSVLFRFDEAEKNQKMLETGVRLHRSGFWKRKMKQKKK